MLADDAFLRRLPSIIDEAQAIQVEALVFSADAVQVSLAAIQQTAFHHRENIVTAGRAIHTYLLMQAWTMVDCAHVVLQILHELDYRTPLAQNFQANYASARKLRNKMDHLAKNASNTALSKRRPPVFGALGYICIPDKNIVSVDGTNRITGGGIVSITAGRAIGSKAVNLVNPSSVSAIVSGFRLDAFDHSLDLEKAAKDLDILIAEMNDTLEKKAIDQAEQEARRSGLPAERLLAHPPAGLSMFIAFTVPSS